MSQTLGIDFGYSANTPSLGYARFDTRTEGGIYRISVVAPSEVTTLDDLKNRLFSDHLSERTSLVALDAPITPTRIVERPVSGRLVEKRFSRGDFCNTSRGPQPSSISVPKQGWPLYSGAMELLVELDKAKFAMPRISDSEHGYRLALTGHDCIEVCPKLTQTLFAPRRRVSSRPDKKNGPAFYRQIDNWLFSHLFVAEPPADSRPTGGIQPDWGEDVSVMRQLLASEALLDNSVWEEASRISSITPLSVRHELIGAFVAGFQGAITLAGAAVAVGAIGDNEGYYVLPARWHRDWCLVWNTTSLPGDLVAKFPIKTPVDGCVFGREGVA